MIKVILWDVDATLLDFLAAEKAAIRSCFRKFGLGECSDEMLARYSSINKKYWENLSTEKTKISTEKFLAWKKLSVDIVDNYIPKRFSPV